MFSKTKDELRERYGVLKCARSHADALEGAHVIGRRDSKFDAELLVDNLPEARRLHPDILAEPAALDDIMTFLAKGVN